MKRIDYIFLLFLFIAVILIFYPVFYARYLYTDEASQLWYAAKKINFNTSVPQGRYITYKVFEQLFKSIHTVHDVIHARLFSLCGWFVCLPVWYFIINKVVLKEGLPKVLVFLALIYIVCMPPFIIYIGWAACLELFIACTTALVAGYLLYSAIKYDGEIVHVPAIAMAMAVGLGVISLFTYQHGFGCFFIPFFIHFISTKKITKPTYVGIIFSLFIYIVYYLLFKFSISANVVEVSSRSAFATNPISKLVFLFTRPLATAFHFTFLFNERSIAGFIIYIIVASAWLLTVLFSQKTQPLSQKISYLLVLVIFFILICLPSLIVKENYASNRTMFALDLAIFLMVAETVLCIIKKDIRRYIATACIAAFFLINAWYNYTKQFINPLIIEYSLLNNFINQHYEPGITAIYFMSPKENTFEKKYGVVQSWDEFGEPSTAKNWVPEPLIKQLIFEKTGNRQIAEQLIVKSWIDKEAFQKSVENLSKNILLINLEEMMAK